MVAQGQYLMIIKKKPTGRVFKWQPGKDMNYFLRYKLIYEACIKLRCSSTSSSSKTLFQLGLKSSVSPRNRYSEKYT